MQDSGKPDFRALLEEFDGDVPAAAFVAHRLGTLKPESDVTFEEWEAIWSSTGDSPSLRELALSGLDASGSFESWRLLWMSLRWMQRPPRLLRLRDRAIERMRLLGTFDDCLEQYRGEESGGDLAVCVEMVDSVEAVRKLFARMDELQINKLDQMGSVLRLYDRLVDLSENFSELDNAFTEMLDYHSLMRNRSFESRSTDDMLKRILLGMKRLGTFGDWSRLLESVRQNRYERAAQFGMNLQAAASEQIWKLASTPQELAHAANEASDLHDWSENAVRRVMRGMSSEEALQLMELVSNKMGVRKKVANEFLGAEPDLAGCIRFLNSYDGPSPNSFGWYKHVIVAALERGSLEEVRELRRLSRKWGCKYRETGMLNRLAELYGATDGSGPEGPEPAAAPVEVEDDLPDGTTDDFSVAF